MKFNSGIGVERMFVDNSISACNFPCCIVHIFVFNSTEGCKKTAENKLQNRGRHFKQEAKLLLG